MIFPVVLFACAALLCGCDVGEMSTLPELSKPYTGVYECTQLTLGGEDTLDRFEFVRLELKADETFALTYRTAEGGEGGVEGEYQMDAERGELVLTKKTALRTMTYVFAVENGAIRGDMNLNGELLHAEFATP